MTPSINKHINSKEKKYGIGIFWWIIIAIVTGLLCFTNIYNDILIVGKASHNMWDSIFSGNPSGIFIRNLIVPGTYYTVEGSGSYPLIAQLMLAVWMFPVWIIGKIAGHSVYNTGLSLMWLKMLLLSCEIFAAKKVYDIVYFVKKDKEEAFKAAFFFVTSALILLNTFVASQIEIATCAFILCGIEKWLEDDLRRFTLYMLIAVGIKYFAAAIFFPMLFMKEKRITRIIPYSLIVSLPFLELLTGNSTAGTASVSGSRFLTAVLTIGPGNFMPFAFVVLLIIALSYIYRCSEKEQDIKVLILYGLIVWGSFCLFASINPYWSVLIVPFFTIGVFLSNEYRKEAIAAETIMSLSLIGIHFGSYPFVYDARTVLEMGIGRGILDCNGVEALPSPMTLMGQFGLGSETVINIIYNISLVAWIILLYLIWKSDLNKVQLYQRNTEMLYKIRSVAMILTGLIPTISFVYFAVSTR